MEPRKRMHAEAALQTRRTCGVTNSCRSAWNTPVARTIHEPPCNCLQHSTIAKGQLIVSLHRWCSWQCLPRSLIAGILSIARLDRTCSCKVLSRPYNEDCRFRFQTRSLPEPSESQKLLYSSTWVDRKDQVQCSPLHAAPGRYLESKPILPLASS